MYFCFAGMPHCSGLRPPLPKPQRPLVTPQRPLVTPQQPSQHHNLSAAGTARTFLMSSTSFISASVNIIYTLDVDISEMSFKG